MRFLGVKIQGYYSSEARVFASLLGDRNDAYRARVLYHVYPGMESCRDDFARESAAEVISLDLAQRQNTTGHGPADKLKMMARFRASFTKALTAAQEFRPDVVYSSQQLWDSTLATYLARNLGVPQVMHLHFNIGPWLRTGFSASPGATLAVMRLLGLADPLERLRTCDHVVTVSEYLRKQVLAHGVPPDRCTAITNTMRPLPPVPGARDEVRAEFGLPHDAPIVGIVARIDPDKGHVDTVEAFSRVAGEFPQARLLLIGDGLIREEVEAKAHASGFADRIVFAGYRVDVPRLLAALDVFCHPSRREPFGLSVAEAAASGLPVVAYAEGGLCEIVAHNATGLLAVPGDVNGLADCLRLLLRDPKMASRMGAAGRERVAACFRPEDAAATFAKVLRATTQRGGKDTA